MLSMADTFWSVGRYVLQTNFNLSVNQWCYFHSRVFFSQQKTAGAQLGVQECFGGAAFFSSEAVIGSGCYDTQYVGK